MRIVLSLMASLPDRVAGDGFRVVIYLCVSKTLSELMT